MIAREWNALPVGYGSMLLESLVAIMALIAACSLQPGVYFAVNSPAGVVGTTPAAAAATISQLGIPGYPRRHGQPGSRYGRKDAVLPYRGRSVVSAGNGAYLRAFAGEVGGRAVLAFWYHFAIMFEALFILTVLYAGTRVGRFMLQDLLGNVSNPLGRSIGCRACW